MTTIVIFYKKIAKGIFLGENDNFWHLIKKNVKFFGNFPEGEHLTIVCVWHWLRVV